MAVFTPVSQDQLHAWLARYPVGRLERFEGIETGIENTNYFVDTADGRWVLTLFERLPAVRLPFHLDLMRHLARRGIACPDPLADRDGALFSMLAGRPAALVTRLPGRGVVRPVPAHCGPVGDLLARMHLEARDYPGRQPNPRGLDWWLETAPRVLPHLAQAPAALLADEVEVQRAFARAETFRALPASAVHADLFRDNVLFDGERLGGVIDFYFAGVDTWLFDLAVACNDWCIDDASGALDPVRLATLLDAYEARRPLTGPEQAAWPTMLRAAALRFWLSRLDDLHRPRPAELVVPKDPSHFERILHARRAGVPPLPARRGAAACR
jgi:homoserine kinase type II